MRSKKVLIDKGIALIRKPPYPIICPDYFKRLTLQLTYFCLVSALHSTGFDVHILSPYMIRHYLFYCNIPIDCENKMYCIFMVRIATAARDGMYAVLGHVLFYLMITSAVIST